MSMSIMKILDHQNNINNRYRPMKRHVIISLLIWSFGFIYAYSSESLPKGKLFSQEEIIVYGKQQLNSLLDTNELNRSNGDTSCNQYIYFTKNIDLPIEKVQEYVWAENYQNKQEQFKKLNDELKRINQGLVAPMYIGINLDIGRVVVDTKISSSTKLSVLNNIQLEEHQRDLKKEVPEALNKLYGTINKSISTGTKKPISIHVLGFFQIFYSEGVKDQVFLNTWRAQSLTMKNFEKEQRARIKKALKQGGAIGFFIDDKKNINQESARDYLNRYKAAVKKYWDDDAPNIDYVYTYNNIEVLEKWYQQDRNNKELNPFVPSTNNDQRVYDYTGLFYSYKSQLEEHLSGYKNVKDNYKVVLTDAYTPNKRIAEIDKVLSEGNYRGSIIRIHIDDEEKVIQQNIYRNGTILNLDPTLSRRIQEFGDLVFSEGFSSEKALLIMLEMEIIITQFGSVVFGGLADGIKATKIPKEFWDSASPGYYFKEIESLVEGIPIIETQVAYIQHSLALITGAYNGLVDTLATVPDLAGKIMDLKLFAKRILSDDGYRKEVTETVHKITGLLKQPEIRDFVWMLASNQLQAMWDKEYNKVAELGDYTGVYYFTGNIVFAVAVGILSGGASTIPKVAKDFLTFLRWVLEPMDFLRKITGKKLNITKPIVKLMKKGYTITKDGVVMIGKEILFTIKITGKIIKVAHDAIIKPGNSGMYAPELSLAIPEGYTVEGISPKDRWIHIMKGSDGSHGVSGDAGDDWLRFTEDLGDDWDKLTKQEFIDKVTTTNELKELFIEADYDEQIAYAEVWKKLYKYPQFRSRSKVLKSHIKVKRIGVYDESIELVEIDNLTLMHPVPGIGKEKDISKLEASFLRNGYSLDEPPIEVFKLPDGTLLMKDGHHRLQAMKNLGQIDIPISIIPYESVQPSLRNQIFYYIEVSMLSGYYKGTFRETSETIISEIRLRAVRMMDKEFPGWRDRHINDLVDSVLDDDMTKTVLKKELEHTENSVLFDLLCIYPLSIEIWEVFRKTELFKNITVEDKVKYYSLLNLYLKNNPEIKITEIVRDIEIKGLQKWINTLENILNNVDETITIGGVKYIVKKLGKEKVEMYILSENNGLRYFSDPDAFMPMAEFKINYQVFTAVLNISGDAQKINFDVFKDAFNRLNSGSEFDKIKLVLRQTTEKDNDFNTIKDALNNNIDFNTSILSTEIGQFINKLGYKIERISQETIEKIKNGTINIEIHFTKGNISVDNSFAFLNNVEGWDSDLIQELQDFVAKTPEIAKLFEDAVDDIEKIKLANAWKKNLTAVADDDYKNIIKLGKNNTPIIIDDSAKNVITFSIDFENEIHEIASFELRNGRLIQFVNIEDKFKLKNQGIGKGMFHYAFDRLGGTNTIDRVPDKFINRELSDNFDSFKENLLNGLTPEQAALSTPTGKWVKDKYPFVKIAPSIVDKIKNSSPTDLIVVKPEFVKTPIESVRPEYIESLRKDVEKFPGYFVDNEALEGWKVLHDLKIECTKENLDFLQNYSQQNPDKKWNWISNDIHQKGNWETWVASLEGNSSTGPLWKISKLKPGEKSYKDVKLLDRIGYGEYKEVFSIKGEPDKVISILKDKNSTSILNKELKALKILSEKGYPIVEILQKTTHNSKPAIVMKRYEESSNHVLKSSESNMLNATSIEELQTIREKIDEKEFVITDLQFLIAKNGTVVIADPILFFNVSSPEFIEANIANNYNVIDELIYIAKRNMGIELENPVWEYTNDIEGWTKKVNDEFVNFVDKNSDIGDLFRTADNDLERKKLAQSWLMLKDYPEYSKNPEIIKSHALITIIGSYDDTRKPLHIDKLSFSGFEDDMSKIKKQQENFSLIGFFMDNAIKIIELPDNTFKIFDKSSYYRYRALQEMGLHFVPVRIITYDSILELVEEVYRNALEIDFKNVQSQKLIFELIGDSKNVSIWKILYNAEVDESIRLNQNNEFFVVSKFMEENPEILPDKISTDIRNIGWERWKRGDIAIDTGDYTKINLKGLELYRKVVVETQQYEKILSYAMMDPHGKPKAPFMLCYLNERKLVADLKEYTPAILEKSLDIKTIDNAFTRLGGVNAIDIVQIVWKKEHPDYDVFKSMIEEKMTIKEALSHTTAEHWAYIPEFEHIVLTKIDDDSIEISVRKEISGNDIFNMVPGHEYEDDLVDDVIEYVDLRDALEVTPDLIDAWVILKNAKVQEEIRCHIAILSLIDNHFDEKYIRIGSQNLSKEIKDMGWDKWIDTYYRYENPILIEKIRQQINEYTQFSQDSENKICINWVEAVTREKNVQKLARIFGLDPAIKGEKMWSSGEKYIADYPNIHTELDELLPNLIQLSNRTERKPYEVYLENGELYNQKLGRLSNHDGLNKKDPLIFVMEANGKIYAGIHKKNIMQHSSFLQGGKVVTAGQFHFYRGDLIIDRRSGHYEPSVNSLSRIVEELTTRGFNIWNIVISAKGY
ncbi:hypothetical protein IWQ47_002266 [Aquimarina sp. EL_43]|uniref:hypothetical protein n=1 Tax=unclassified Aquimarina TaxID=2627091 RepID=UPI0018CACDB2|nr:MULTISPECIES: hypothetical protein [unclassified Aquimarina]MBG6130802.1 hypothetical protein [Aquimarina sp. EL_35]MBG6151051.1 hypothetical protein [Aquimarina sp. EL_32]MBG6169192.1 hypothetical protein [Aquimarina sp. EL_43]